MKDLHEYLDPPTPEAVSDRDGAAVLAMMRRVHRKQKKQRAHEQPKAAGADNEGN